MERTEETKIIDDEHLKLLSYAHLIDGGITVAFSSFFILHFLLLQFVSSNIDNFNEALPKGQPMPVADFFHLFTYFVGFFILIGITYGICKIVSYYFIKQRKNRMFSFIVAIPGLIFIPYGTLLGYVTIKVLGRQSVKEQYRDQEQNLVR